MAAEMSHFDEKGNAVMVDVSGKEPTNGDPRTMMLTYSNGSSNTSSTDNTNTSSTAKTHKVKKGDVLGVARVAGIMAVKQTSSIIPMCHPLMLSKCSIDFELNEEEMRRLFQTLSTTIPQKVRQLQIICNFAAQFCEYECLKIIKEEY